MGRMVYLFILFSAFVYAADVTLTWNPNRDDDLGGYRIHYGRAPGQYQTSVDAGNVLSYTLTDLQENTEYFFALSAYDQTGNESALCADISGVPGDSQAPRLISVTPASATELRLGFNKILNKASAENIANYSIHQGINVQSALLQSDRKTVVLTTSAHQSGQTYSLQAANICDIAIPVNTMTDPISLTYYFGSYDGDTTSPTILLARLSSATVLEIIFSESIDAASAIDLHHYYINQGISVTAVELDVSGNTVRLTTNEHSAGQNYVLTVNNVRDRSVQGNTILPNSYYSYAYEPIDRIGPVINLVHAIDVDLIDVMFNEPVDKTSAENTSNYTIQNNVQVLQASLDATGQVVHLQTSAHVTDRLYILNVRNVSDVSASKNIIGSGAAYAYVFTPVDHTGPVITEVQVKDAMRLAVIFNEPLDRRTAEDIGHYQINNDVHVLSAALDLSGRVVDLQTTPHVQGRLYILFVNQLLDATAVGNEILPNSSYTYVHGGDGLSNGPTIVSVEVQSATSLVVQFSKQVQRSSAELTDHYQLSRGVVVFTAKLDDSGKRVILQTSPHEANKVYILSINNVSDATAFQNVILPNSTYSYVFEGADTVGPVITLVKVVDEENLDLLFNEGLAKSLAETVSNYSISGNIIVLNARLDGSRRMVHLQTTAHQPQKLYVLRISGLKDESLEQNPIAANSSYSYLYEPADALPPTLAMVRVQDPQHLQIAFSEAVETASAMNRRNYALNNGIEIVTVTADADGHLYILEISPLTPGKIYLLLANQIRDLAGNTIAANSSYAFSYGNVAAETLPAIVKVDVFSNTELEVTFNLPVEKAVAEKTDNYCIQDISVLGARLDYSQTRVLLTTVAHESGRVYVLTISSIYRQGRPDLIIQPHTPYFYMLRQEPETAPAVDKVVAAGERLVEVYFSQPVEPVTAENRRNYHINNDIVVLFATLDDAQKKVILETSRHEAGQVYTLSVNGVQNESGQASISSAVIAYTYVPGLQINIVSSAECLLSFLDIGKPYYVDRNYLITQAPGGLLHSRLIMTCNNDKGRSDSRYLAMQLNQATIVYVAYDAFAVSVPAWLNSRFIKTALTISVSENTAELALWAAYYPAGPLELGGNNAAGASGSKCMYIVLMQEPAFAQILSMGELESLQEKSKVLPQSVVLHHNYPNPFNPRTAIKYELPSEKQVRLMVYDILGRQVRALVSGRAAAGVYTLEWDGANELGTPAAAGIYFYRLEVWQDGWKNGVLYRSQYQAVTKKMILLK